jgi:hypothetical protein
MEAAMKRIKLFQLVIIIGSLLILSGCGPRAIPTPVPPTLIPTSTAIPCAGLPASSEELTLQVQTRSGVNVGSGGVLIAPGGSVSFGASGETTSAGFWKSIDNGKYTVRFLDSNGNPMALTELQGEVQWDATSCIVKGGESFLRIMVEQDKWLNISKQEIVQGHLVLTDENGGKYVILVFNPAYGGVMAKQ